MIIASLLRFVNAYGALPRKTLLDKSRFRKEMDMLGQITARDNLILVLQKDCYCRARGGNMANRDHSLDDGIVQAAYSEFLSEGLVSQDR